MSEGDGVAISNSRSINTSVLELVDECLIVIGSHRGPAAVTAKVRVSRDSAKKIELFFEFAAPKFGSFKKTPYLCSVRMSSEGANDLLL